MNREKIALTLRPMDYANVELKPGPFKEQFDRMLEYFLALPDDDILLGFRRRAGRPHPGRELGGWYSNDGSFNVYDWDEIFNTFGQWLSLLGRAYRATGDQRVYDKAKRLLKAWGETIAEDGYFFYSDECNAWHYSYEKIMSGLVDLYVYAGLAEARTHLEKITAWAEANLHRTRMTAGSVRDNFTGGDPSIKLIDNEWYTLSEGLYRMYLATGDERYRSFAEVWHYDAYWDALRGGDEAAMTGVHGYSHVNNLGGAAMAYRVTGEDKYLKTILAAYEILKRNQLMASGGYAFDEHMADPDGSNYLAVERMPRSYEVPCGSWAAFKLTRHLISLTGEARYGEWAETTLYNAIGAALPMADDDRRRGRTFYYADYRIGGGRKVYYEHSFPCCAGTYPQALTEYFNAIYYTSDDCLYATQYVPSRVSAPVAGMQADVEIRGDYPESDSFEIVVNAAGAFKLALRVPSWLRGGEGGVKINGEASGQPLVPGGWAVFDRAWNAGDVLRVTFPMHLWTWPISKQHPERAALMYGPVMLTALGQHWTLKGDVQNPEGIARKGAGLCFTGSDDAGNPVKFVPFYAVGERVWNTVYCDYAP